VFELGDTIVREVMVPRTDMVFVERGKTLRQALAGTAEWLLPDPGGGTGEDDIVGIAYLKDPRSAPTSTATASRASGWSR
jgi:CBS domain containing-hemolysin-like protein